MTLKKLMFVAVIGMTGSAALLMAAVWISGRSLADQGYGWGKSRAACADVSPEQADISIPYSGGSNLTLDLPATVTYDPQGEQSVTVRGNKALVERVKLQGGKLYLDCEPVSSDFKLEVNITGVRISGWTVLGRGDLLLKHLSQPTLRLDVNGSGSVSASGTATDLDLTVNGSGSVSFENAITESARIKLRGSGDALLNVRQTVDVSIFGSGNVQLLGNPTIRRQELRGSGTIRHASE